MGNHITVYQPLFVSFSNIRISGVSFSSFFFEKAVIKTFERMKSTPNLLYGHFWTCGLIAGIIGEKHHLPVFVASGESKIRIHELYPKKKIKEYCKNITGVICVSSKNLQESLDLNLAPREKMAVIPNAIDKRIFHPMDKALSRKILGFREDDFIVAFIGHFDQRKGILRLSEALKKVDDAKAIFIGSGQLKPEAPGILFCGKLPHEEIPLFLNASDVFVLPTLAEGCCNAIIEAMACGLPIVSSHLSFNDDILDDNNSIRVDSMNVEKIAQAIQLLKDNPQKREEMSKASLEKAKEFDIKVRAKRVLDFIQKKVAHQCS